MPRNGSAEWEEAVKAVNVAKLKMIAVVFDLAPPPQETRDYPIDPMGSCFDNIECHQALAVQSDWETSTLMNPQAFITGIDSKDLFPFISLFVMSYRHKSRSCLTSLSVRTGAAHRHLSVKRLFDMFCYCCFIRICLWQLTGVC